MMLPPKRVKACVYPDEKKVQDHYFSHSFVAPVYHRHLGPVTASQCVLHRALGMTAALLSYALGVQTNACILIIR